MGPSSILLKASKTYSGRLRLLYQQIPGIKLSLEILLLLFYDWIFFTHFNIKKLKMEFIGVKADI